MPTKRSGLRKSPRGASTPPPATPLGSSASPKSPASGLGSKRKSKRSPKSTPRRKKVLKRLYPRDDVDPDDQEDDVPATGGSGDEDLQDPNPLSAPEDVPSLVEELEASDDPLMQRLGQELRDRDSREDALRNELAAVKRDAEQRQAIRDYEENAPTKFCFPPDAIKRAINLFVIPSLRDDTIRRFYSNIEVSATTQASVTRAFSLVKLTKSARNKIYGRRLRDSRLSTKPRSLSEGETAMYTKEQLAKERYVPDA